MQKLKNCFERGKLIRTRKDLQKSEKSLETAEKKVGEARKLHAKNFLDAALLSAYTSMFHASRALLYRDGIQEKSHFCLIEYLREEYAKKNKINNEIITVMDAFRVERHDIMYGLEPMEIKKENVSEAIKTAEKLIDIVRSLIFGA